jgi:carbohydrate-selective porin OprB
VYDWSKPFDGGQGAGYGFGRYSFDLSMAVDGKKLFGMNGSDGLVRLKHHINAFGEACNGSYQSNSNIDAPSRTNLYELWWQQRLWSGRLRLKGGKIDANTEFAVVQNAGDFLNASMGYSPTIMAFPTYPEPRMGINAFVQPTKFNTIGFGLFQASGSGLLSVVEGGQAWQAGQTELPGRASVGYWRKPGSIERFDGNFNSGAQGLYSVVEQSLWRGAWSESDAGRHLTAFLQLGEAQGAVSPVTRHVGAGSVLQGPFHRRSGDGIGTAVTWVRFSSDPAAGFDFASELVLESYYKAAINKHVSFVQDFQYLHHPGGLRHNGDCPVIMPRLMITF